MTEQQIIEYEAARNKAMDKYFGARPQIFRTQQMEMIFDAGFRMSWEHPLNWSFS